MHEVAQFSKGMTMYIPLCCVVRSCVLCVPGACGCHLQRREEYCQIISECFITSEEVVDDMEALVLHE